MKIALNDQTLVLTERSRLDQLLEQEFGERAGLAVAINGDVIPRSRWTDMLLTDGDRIDVFHAVAGG